MAKAYACLQGNIYYSYVSIIAPTSRVPSRRQNNENKSLALGWTSQQWRYAEDSSNHDVPILRTGKFGCLRYTRPKPSQILQTLHGSWEVFSTFSGYRSKPYPWLFALCIDAMHLVSRAQQGNLSGPAREPQPEQRAKTLGH